MKRFFCTWLVALIAFASMPAGAVESGEAVVVVYNQRMAESREVAEHYAKQRGVPAAQVIGLRLPTIDAMTRDEYNEQLQGPLFKALEKEKLFVLQKSKNGDSGRKVVAAKIRYLVLCYGVPVRIYPEPKLMTEEVLRLKAEMRRNEAAVDSELALLPKLEQMLPLHGPAQNVCFAVTNAAFLHPTNGIIMVARLDGPSAAIARGLVDKAIAAETNGLWGRAYFDVRGLTEGEYKKGDNSIGAAAQYSRRFGFETIVDERPETFSAAFPMSQIALYAGWYDTVVSGPFTRPEVEFMPGAIAYHLFSYSASNLRSPTQSWVGAFLAKGATATLGCVDEPYLEGTPDMDVFFSRLLLLNFSLGEAAYASQIALSWQTTVVGDPLYRPFIKAGPQLHQELQKRNDPLLPWSNLRIVNINLATGAATKEMIGYLRQLPLTRTSSVLSEKMGDLLLGEGKTSDAVDAYVRALRQETTPQQRIRLLLTLADKQAALEREDQALDTYQQFLKKFPNYPDLLSIYQKALALADKLKKTDEAEQYRREIKRLTGANK